MTSVGEHLKALLDLQLPPRRVVVAGSVAELQVVARPGPREISACRDGWLKSAGLLFDHGHVRVGGEEHVSRPSPQDPNRQLRLARAIELRIVMGGVYVVCCSSNGPKHYLHPQLNRGQWCAPDTTFR